MGECRKVGGGRRGRVGSSVGDGLDGGGTGRGAGKEEEQGRKRDKEEEEWVDWLEEAREKFRRKTEEWKRKGRRIESEVEELLEGIKERILVKRKKKGTERKEG